MTSPEYQVQLLRTRAQWESGLAFRLSLEEQGIALVSSPSFHAWLPAVPVPRGARCSTRAAAMDECGQVLGVDCCRPAQGGSGGGCAFWLHNRVTGITERLGALDRACTAADRRVDPARLWTDPHALWVLDRAAGRILGFARDTLQLLHEIRPRAPIDADYDGEGLFVVLERVGGRVRVGRYEARPRRGPAPHASECLDDEGRPAWSNPVGIALGGGWAWVLDAGPDCRSPRFVRVPLVRADPRGDPCPPPGRCEIVPIPRGRAGGCETMPGPGLDPGFTLPCGRGIGCEGDPGPHGGAQRIAADRDGSLFVPFTDPGGRARLVQFDAAGSLLGEVRLPAPPGGLPGTALGRIDGLAAGPGGELLLLTDAGVALFTPEHVAVGASGDWYSRTLDSGVEEGSWHRVALRADLPRGTRLEVRACASDQHALRESIDTVLAEPARLPHEKRGHVESLLGPLWEVVADFKGADDHDPVPPPGERDAPSPRPDSALSLTHDALFLKGRGRYLWLKLSLHSYDESSRPAVHELQVFHPRRSYLRYLPATFQEVPGDPSADPPERDFLMRFLSLFETPLRALDLEIDQLADYFDPALAPAGFLPWLAGWLNAAVEEDWPEERRRRLIARAWPLFEAKGTPRGLAELIELLTGFSVRIVEDARLARPTPLGGEWEWRLGLNTFVRRAPVGGFRVGESSVGGAALLDKGPRDPADPFAALAHRFTVLVFGAGDRRAAEPLLRRLIDEHTPAHSACTLRLIDDGVMDAQLRVGVNTRLAGAAPLRLGRDTTLGRAITVSRTPPRTSLGAAVLPGRGLELT